MNNVKSPASKLKALLYLSLLLTGLTVIALLIWQWNEDPAGTPQTQQGQEKLADAVQDLSQEIQNLRLQLEADDPAPETEAGEGPAPQTASPEDGTPRTDGGNAASMAAATPTATATPVPVPAATVAATAVSTPEAAAPGICGRDPAVQESLLTHFDINRCQDINNHELYRITGSFNDVEAYNLRANAF